MAIFQLLSNKKISSAEVGKNKPNIAHLITSYYAFVKSQAVLRSQCRV